MSILEGLNDRQMEAVRHFEGPMLILAGAGSGKTRVLINRIAWLMEEKQVSPWNIMAITFTNKAAQEMRDRAGKMVGFGAESLWVATFHSTCVRILRRFADHVGYGTNFVIYDGDDQKTLMKDVCKRLQIDTKMLPERSILAAISSAKDSLTGPEQYREEAGSDFRRQKIASAYTEYQAALRKNNAMDFDDLIMKTTELFDASPDVLAWYQERFRFIMVDEYQDTNTAQFRLIWQLASKYKNLCVVGDDDQSIYKFRGANIGNILNFEKYFPEAHVVRLEQNYRSTQSILDAANSVIRNNESRKEKSLWTENGEGKRCTYLHFPTGYDEAQFAARMIRERISRGEEEYGDFAVLYRTNAQSRMFEEQFVRENIPYRLVGGVNFYARREIKDLLAYLKLVDNGLDDLSARRVINVPKRGIGATTIGRVQEYAYAHEISFFEALLGADKIPGIGRGGAKTKPFTDLIMSLREREAGLAARYGGLTAKEQEENGPVTALLRELIERTGYVRDLQAEETEEAQERIQNIDELISKAADYEEAQEAPTLRGFLEEVALVAEVDSLEDERSRVTLMTLHSAKGLEFPIVILAGMEDGIFPSYQSIESGSREALEEERRLCYVGITRAMRELVFTGASSRMVRGEVRYNPVSRFIREIPDELLDTEDALGGRGFSRAGRGSTAGFGQAGAGGASGFGRQSGRAFTDSYGEGSGASGKAAGRGAGRADGLFSAARKTIKEKLSLPEKGAPQKPASLDYGPGDRVAHVKFGEGTVQEIRDGGRDFEVTVEFDKYGRKKMFAAFAKLRKVE